MRRRCALRSQKMRIKLAQSVHRSTIGDEKYFLDYVQSFIVGGKWGNEWGGKKIQMILAKWSAGILFEGESVFVRSGS